MFLRNTTPQPGIFAQLSLLQHSQTMILHIILFRLFVACFSRYRCFPTLALCQLKPSCVYFRCIVVQQPCSKQKKRQPISNKQQYRQERYAAVSTVAVSVVAVSVVASVLASAVASAKAESDNSNHHQNFSSHLLAAQHGHLLHSAVTDP